MTYTSASIRKGAKGPQGLKTYDQEQTRVMGEGQQEWANPNIKSCTHAIAVLLNAHAGSVAAAINARILEAQGDKTIRKDAVRMLTFFATMPDYSRRTEDERRAFARLVFEFLAGKYGAKNIVDLRWHFDENAPHLHATIVPITPDGRLCCKEVFKPTKKRQEQWQRDYYEAVGKPMGYDEPEFGHSNEKGYTSSTVATRKQFKAMQARRDAAEVEAIMAEADTAAVRAELVETRGELGAIKEDVSKKRDLSGVLENEIAEKTAEKERIQAELDEISAEAAASRARLEELRQNEEESLKEVEVLEWRIAEAEQGVKSVGRQVRSLRERTRILAKDCAAFRDRLAAAIHAGAQAVATIPEELRALVAQLRERGKALALVPSQPGAVCKNAIRIRPYVPRRSHSHGKSHAR